MSEVSQIISADNVKLREDGRAVIIIDQSLLPGETKHIELDTLEKMHDAIFYLRVRGAPAIGICAAYCMAVLAAAEVSGGESGRTLGAACQASSAMLGAACQESGGESCVARQGPGEAGSVAGAVGDFAAGASAGDGSNHGLVIGGSGTDGGDEARNPDRKSAVFLEKMERCGEYLKSSRPTAVNLAWAVDRVLAAAQDALQMDCSARSTCIAGGGADVLGGNVAGIDRTAEAHNNNALGGRGVHVPGSDAAYADCVQGVDHGCCTHLAEAIKQEAFEIHREDIEMCRAISEYGLTLVRDGDGILTHCNAGPLATSQYGTALGPILLGKERGMDFKVFADETRPLLQGARLTAYELQKAGVDVTLICDNMASMVMKNGWVQACFVGCDRVAANGDTANKIGTSGVAILAKHYGIPFYVLGPVSTIDLNCTSGEEIPIELRQPQEIKEKFYQTPMALSDVKCYNPAFDVTDHRLITAIVTDKGICRPPFTESLRRAKMME